MAIPGVIMPPRGVVSAGGLTGITNQWNGADADYYTDVSLTLPGTIDSNDFLLVVCMGLVSAYTFTGLTVGGTLSGVTTFGSTYNAGEYEAIAAYKILDTGDDNDTVTFSFSQVALLTACHGWIVRGTGGDITTVENTEFDVNYSYIATIDPAVCTPDASEHRISVGLNINGGAALQGMTYSPTADETYNLSGGGSNQTHSEGALIIQDDSGSANSSVDHLGGAYSGNYNAMCQLS